MNPENTLDMKKMGGAICRTLFASETSARKANLLRHHHASRSRGDKISEDGRKDLEYDVRDQEVAEAVSAEADQPSKRFMYENTIAQGRTSRKQRRRWG